MGSKLVLSFKTAQKASKSVYFCQKSIKFPLKMRDLKRQGWSFSCCYEMKMASQMIPVITAATDSNLIDGINSQNALLRVKVE